MKDFLLDMGAAVLEFLWISLQFMFVLAWGLLLAALVIAGFVHLIGAA